MKKIIKKIIYKYRNWFFPSIKKCKNYTVYRVKNDSPTIIVANFIEITDMKLPKETTSFIACQNPMLTFVNISEIITKN